MDKKRLLYIIPLLFFIFPASAKNKTHTPSNQTKGNGNFALPISQQPGPFFSFGQNIISKDTAQVYLAPNYLQQTTQHYFTQNQAFLYGLTDTASLLFSVPVALDYKSGVHHSSGFGDISAQGEYAFYSNDKNQATVMGAVSLPTGSYNSSPSTGNGSMTYFIGTTYNHTDEHWLWFVTPSAMISTPHNDNRIGSKYFYQGGIGRNISSKPGKYIVTGLLEVDGQYAQKNKAFGLYNPDTGGNIIFVTPSLWLSNPVLIVQLGVSIPVTQYWNGHQSYNNYSASVSFGWTLH